MNIFSPNSGIMLANKANTNMTVTSSSGSNNVVAYVVQKNNTASGITNLFNCELNDLKRLNPSIQDFARIKPGQKIFVPAASHVVKSGETFNDIARRYNVKREDLKKANPQIKDFDKLYPNMTLVIPLSKEAQNKAKQGVAPASKPTVPAYNVAAAAAPRASEPFPSIVAQASVPNLEDEIAEDPQEDSITSSVKLEKSSSTLAAQAKAPAQNSAKDEVQSTAPSNYVNPLLKKVVNGDETYYEYTLVEGDTLCGIGEKLNINSSLLKEYNKLTDKELRTLRAGKKIKVPAWAARNAEPVPEETPYKNKATTLIKKHEQPTATNPQIAEERLTTWSMDPSGKNLSVGWGHNKVPSDGAVLEKDTITKEQAEDYLRSDINLAEKRVIANIGRDNYDKLTDNQKIALISLVHNAGADAKNLFKLIRAGKIEDAMLQFDNVKINSKCEVALGLLKRRVHEMIYWSNGKGLTAAAKDKVKDLLQKRFGTKYGTFTSYINAKETLIGKYKELKQNIREGKTKGDVAKEFNDLKNVKEIFDSIENPQKTIQDLEEGKGLVV